MDVSPLPLTGGKVIGDEYTLPLTIGTYIITILGLQEQVHSKIINESFDCNYLSFIFEENYKTRSGTKNRIYKLSIQFFACLIFIYIEKSSRWIFLIAAILWSTGCHIWQFILNFKKKQKVPWQGARRGHFLMRAHIFHFYFCTL